MIDLKTDPVAKMAEKLEAERQRLVEDFKRVAREYQEAIERAVATKVTLSTAGGLPTLIDKAVAVPVVEIVMRDDDGHRGWLEVRLEGYNGYGGASGRSDSITVPSGTYRVLAFVLRVGEAEG